MSCLLEDANLISRHKLISHSSIFSGCPATSSNFQGISWWSMHFAEMVFCSTARSDICSFQVDQHTQAYSRHHLVRTATASLVILTATMAIGVAMYCMPPTQRFNLVPMHAPRTLHVLDSIATPRAQIAIITMQSMGLKWWTLIKTMRMSGARSRR